MKWICHLVLIVPGIILMQVIFQDVKLLGRHIALRQKKSLLTIALAGVNYHDHVSR